MLCALLSFPITKVCRKSLPSVMFVQVSRSVALPNRSCNAYLLLRDCGKVIETEAIGKVSARSGVSGDCFDLCDVMTLSEVAR